MSRKAGDHTPVVVVSLPMAESVRTIIADRLAAHGIRSAPDPRQLYAPGRSELLRLLPGALGLITTSDVVDAELLEAGAHLRVISKCGVGIDSIDVQAATSAGVKVAFTPGVNANTVADLTMWLLLSLTRNFSVAHDRAAWMTPNQLGREISGKTLGLLGCGAIAREVAVRARASGMDVIAASRSGAPGSWRDGIELVASSELLDRSDVLSIHVPLTDETRGMIGESELSRMKQGSYLINTARGGVVDEAALLASLQSGHLAGAGLDVFSNEPPSDESLVRHGGVVATTHVGGATHEALARAAIRAADNVIAVLQGAVPADSVN